MNITCIRCEYCGISDDAETALECPENQNNPVSLEHQSLLSAVDTPKVFPCVLWGITINRPFHVGCGEELFYRLVSIMAT